jgi:hypothetical protein
MTMVHSILLLLAAAPVDPTPEAVSPSALTSAGHPTRSQSVPARSIRLDVGTQVGAPLVVGATARASLRQDGRSRFDVDVTWEPSAWLQSYSLGAAWHVLDRAGFIGGRIRWLQFQAPWARSYHADTDNHLGLGVEAGLRLGLGPLERLGFHAALFATYVPTQSSQLQFLFGLNVGLTYAVFEAMVE